jgi:hypothetical protein
MAHSYSNQTPKKSRFCASIALALSLSIGSSAFADVNQTINGQTIPGGTFYNTADGKTTFTNNNGAGDLHLPTGNTVRGLEYGTGNGGTLHFYAPGGMVRLDGNIDVSALKSGNAYMGNGGRVFVDSAFVFQNGTIFANGYNGGTVQFNVGGAMFGPNAKIQAAGFGGLAGNISVNSSGIVDIQQGALFDASGRSISARDASSNVNINIVGSLVNNEGVIKANAVTEDLTTGEIAFASRGESIQIENSGGTDGGVIRIVATGQTRTDCIDCVADKAEASGVLSAEEAADLKSRHDALVAAHDGDVVNTGTIQANGADGSTPIYWDGDYKSYDGPEYPTTSSKDGGNGGVIIASAADDITNDGLIQANGGNGADHYDYSEISTLSKKLGDYDNTTSLAGKGGNGGVISLSATDTVTNGTTTGECKTSDATIEANGGHGGSHYGTAEAYVTDIHTGGESEIVVVGPNSQLNNINAAEAAIKNAIKHDGTEGAKADATAYADNSDYAGGQGGTGGAIGISYGKTLQNNGTIAAKGGNGGNGPSASAYAKATTNVSKTYKAYYKENNRGKFTIKSITSDAYVENAYAKAVAKGGNGGNGGQGGIVVLSGPVNPTGNGLITVNGGHGGNGGNATATAYAKASGAYAQAEATAIAGAGGQGGKAGYVVAPSTSVTFNYSAKDGNSGVAGEAQAKAEAVGKSGWWSDKEYAKAYAKGNNQSDADAVARHRDEDTDVINPTFDPFNNSLQKTQANELLVHGNTAILMSKDGKYGNYAYLSDRLDDATVRTVNDPLYGETLPEKGLDPIRHFTVASIVTKPALNLDKPSTRLINLNNLTSLTVTTTGDVTVPAGELWTAGIASTGWFSSDIAQGGGHISVVAPKGTIINGGALMTFGLHTGGSVALAGVAVKNGLDIHCGGSPGVIITNGLIHGGSIILKGSEAVENLAVPGGKGGDRPSLISSGALLFPSLMGGTIRLQSLNGWVFNESPILANGLLHGGSIIAKAYTAAINNGVVQAKAYGLPVSSEASPILMGKTSLVEVPDEETPVTLTGSGGFIRWHGNGLAVNGSIYNTGAVMDVTGPAQGGIIQLTAGGPTSLNAAWLPQLVDGVGITQGTLLPLGNASVINSLAALPLGSALNAGIMDARATNTDGTIGQIDIAGDAFAGIEGTSIINGQPYAPGYFTNPLIGGPVRLVAGEGAVKAVVCGGDVPETPFNPETPNTPVVTKTLTPFTFNIGGLPFQYYRPDLIGTPVNQKLVLRLGKGSSFLAKGYASVTQEILTLAVKEYNRELAYGKTPDKALASTIHYLQDSGISADVALQLAEAIDAGSFKAEAPVLKALKTLGAEAGEVIRQ